ncbi:cytochrome P450 27C1-like [Amphiura filiformis]|uniref:cytochrome P450 27C1-like n=1 Tax=Amphiura filiformis TaxID=82378 RepID=UPI003B216FA5
MASKVMLFSLRSRGLKRFPTNFVERVFTQHVRNISTCKALYNQCPYEPEQNRTVTRKASGVAASVSSTDTVRSFDEIPSVKIPGGLPAMVYRFLTKGWKSVFDLPSALHLRYFEQLGPIFKQQMATGWLVCINSPDDFQTVFHEQGKYPSRIPVDIWVEHREVRGKPVGVLLGEQETWHKHRSALGKRISRPVEIGRYVEEMNDVITNLVGKMRLTRQPDLVIKNLDEELFKWAMESVSRVFFDRKLNLLSSHLQPEGKAFIQSVHSLSHDTVHAMALPIHWHRRLNSGPYKKVLGAWDTVFEIAEKYVGDKIRDLETKVAAGEKITEESFVAYLVREGKLNDEEIISSLTEMFSAAIDTVSNTVLWTLYLLGRNPDKQQKLYEEICNTVPKGTQPTKEHIDHLPYLKGVIRESLRIFPVAPGVARVLDHDIVIQGFNVPAGNTINCLTVASGRDEKNFDDPLEFRPERWLQGGKKYHPYATLPFGFGIRMCIGRRFAEQELYLIITRIMQQFQIEATKEVGSKHTIFLTPDGEMDLKFSDRK